MYSYTILDEESELTLTFLQKSTDNIFKMASLSVKRSILISSDEIVNKNIVLSFLGLSRFETVTVLSQLGELYIL